MSSPDIRPVTNPTEYQKVTHFRDPFWPELIITLDIGASPSELEDWATLIFMASELNFGDNE